ncbi:hypothetical protein BURK_009146 [Burkholderia sp. SJ98]|nr:hypothetical protein BURK_009146 [Burkholderia sp. SJ98]
MTKIVKFRSKATPDVLMLRDLAGFGVIDKRIGLETSYCRASLTPRMIALRRS